VATVGTMVDRGARGGSRRVDDLVEPLLWRGVRVTPPPRAVLESLAALGSHVTAEALHEDARGRHPALSASSVYRTMDLLHELGIVSHVHLGHGPAEYHLVVDDHAHAVCDACGAVAEVPATVTDAFADEVSARLGFELDLGHFALTGRCRRCAAGAAGEGG
jgi:Fur family transcriptional regulator, ferric uptake regulator